MFCSTFDDAERKAFLVLAMKVALADHRVPFPEGLFVDELKKELGGDTPVDASGVYGEADLEPFKSAPSRVLVMLNLYCLAYADDEFHANEAQVIEDVGQAFGFSDEEIAQLAKWGANQSALMREAEKLMGADAGAA